jgi:hypothetical protein
MPKYIPSGAKFLGNFPVLSPALQALALAPGAHLRLQPKQ